MKKFKILTSFRQKGDNMKSKLSWIPFIPLTLGAVVITILQKFSIGFSSDDVAPAYISLGLILIMFVVNIVFAAMDKETSPAYILNRNIPAAVFGIIAAAMIASYSALRMILALQALKFNVFILAMTVFGMLTAICLVVISLAHVQGRNFLPKMGALFLSMPVWGGLILINEFLNNRTVSVYSVDPFKLFCYSFAMIYLFKLSMVVATINGKNPVKSMFLYGFPLAGIGICMGVNTILSIALNGLDYSEDVIVFAFLALSIYVILFNVEITKNSYTKEEQILKYDLDDFDEEQRVYGANQDNTVVTPETQTGDYDYDYSVGSEDAESYVTAADDNYTDDYDYDYTYGDTKEADDLVVAPDIEVEDDAIYVEKDLVENFEEGVLESNQEAKAIEKEVEVSDEDKEKIDKLLDDINS